MVRHAFSVLAVTMSGVLLGYACTPPAPKPLDTGTFPSASTSAQPLFISTEPTSSSSSSASAGATLAVPPASPLADLPTDLTLSFADRVAACPRPACWRSGLVPKPGDTTQSPLASQPDLGVPSPVALWKERMPPKGRLDFPRAKGFGMAGVVLKGVVAVVPSEGGNLAALQTWGAFVAPGAGFALTSHDTGAEVLLVAWAEDGKLADRIADLRAHEKAYFWGQRPATLAIADLQRSRDLAWADGQAHARMAFDRDQSPRAYVGTLALGSHVPVAAHAHAGSWEVLIPLRASGAIVLSGEGLPADRGPFPKEIQVRSGTPITMPTGVNHAWKPGGTEPLIAIQLFLPPGPEERYSKLAEGPAASSGK